MEKITTDISSFENLRKGGYAYVDKTDLLWRLTADKTGRQFFVSRPRRFGKSLMLSTLKCIFEGKRDLFKGLKIEKKRWDWTKTYPVVMLDMSKAKRYFLLFMRMIGANPLPEVASLRGYADAIIETRKFVRVFEFKFNKTAKAAIRQIREKGCADAYKGDKRPVTLVGINFRTAKRNIWTNRCSRRCGELVLGNMV